MRLTPETDPAFLSAFLRMGKPDVLKPDDAASVLAAVRETRAARSLVLRAGAGPPLRLHRFFNCFGDVDASGAPIVLQVVTKLDELVPAPSLFEFVRQAAVEQVEVCREVARRGLSMPRELPIDEPYASALNPQFVGIEKGLANWEAHQDWEDRDYDFGVRQAGEPRGSILSFLVDRDALAALARRQLSNGAVARTVDNAWATPVKQNVLSFAEPFPCAENDVAAFLAAVCSTDCGGAGADGLWLEVAEAPDYRGRYYAEANIFSTREGTFSHVETHGPHTTTPFYAFAAGDAPEVVVALCSQDGIRKHEQAQRAMAYWQQGREGQLVFVDPGLPAYLRESEQA